MNCKILDGQILQELAVAWQETAVARSRGDGKGRGKKCLENHYINETFEKSKHIGQTNTTVEVFLKLIFPILNWKHIFQFIQIFLNQVLRLLSMEATLEVNLTTFWNFFLSASQPCNPLETFSQRLAYPHSCLMNGKSEPVIVDRNVSYWLPKRQWWWHSLLLEWREVSKVWGWKRRHLFTLTSCVGKLAGVEINLKMIIIFRILSWWQTRRLILCSEPKLVTLDTFIHHMVWYHTIP